MADVVRTCANCGNTQTVGDFCEKCGTRMPAAAAAPAAPPPAAAQPAAPAPPSASATAPVAAAAAYTAARASTPPPTAPPASAPQSYAAPQYEAAPQYGPQGQYGAPAPGAPPQYGYAQPRSGWGKLFDFSFQGFVTESTLKTLYIINLAAIGLFVLFNIILTAISPWNEGEGTGMVVMEFFISLCVAVFWFFLSRIIFELMATAMRIRDKDK